MGIIDIKSLHALEIKVLLHYNLQDVLTNARLEADLNYKEGHANQAFSWLCAKSLVKEVERKRHTLFEITQIGKDVSIKGTDEERMIALLQEKGDLSLPQIAQELSIENKNVGSAFGILSKEKVVVMNEQKQVHLISKELPIRVILIKSLLKEVLQVGHLDKDSLSADECAVIMSLAKKRGAADSLFKIVEKEVVVYKLTQEAMEVAKLLKSSGLTGSEIGEVTQEILQAGDWKNNTFRQYNIGIMPARIIQGRTNPYVSFLERVKDKLCSLGFEEFDGSLIETEFWNGDALFMPQFHAARDIHDVYRIKKPTHAKSIKEPFLTNVANVHNNGGNTGSRGWNYDFDTEFTRRLILRSQGTVLSAHKLANAKIPGKYFGIARCFRYDKVDATHLSDFYQTEGIVLGKEVNLRTLLGFLKMFATQIAGATEVKYVPGYFPFTEPSIEVHIKHPVLGWFELGGSGIFRPEVTRAMGVDVPVLAWGIGIDRMALMALGLNDLRELFCEDIEQVRLRRSSIKI